MKSQKAPDADVQVTREKIIMAAEQLFREVGYAKTTMADIARSLGMSPGNIYRFFKTKGHISGEICGRLVRAVEEQSLNSMAQEGSYVERIRSFVVAYHRAITKILASDSLLHEMLQDDEKQHQENIQNHCERIRRIMYYLMEQGAEAGEYRDWNRYQMARAMHEAVATFIYPPLLMRFRTGGIATYQGHGLEEQLLFLLDMLMDGIMTDDVEK